MNEMPYPPHQRVVEAARRALTTLNRYADPEVLRRLQKGLADYAGVPERHVILGPGSDLLLREIVHAFSSGRQVVMVSPSFFPTVQAAKQFAPHRLSLRIRPPNFDLNLDLLTAALDEASLLILDNPNNPTGHMLLDRQAVEAILEHRGTLLVIDEAYYEFSGTTFAEQVPRRPNLAVIRTMDKAFSLAGARIGYAILGEAFLEAFSTFYAFLPRPSVCAALESLQHMGYMRTNVCRIIEEREHLRQALEALGVSVYPSSANFMLVRTEIPDAVKRLREAGALVAGVPEQLPPGFIRVSVGTREENDAFLTLCMKICATGKNKPPGGVR
ncbi:MAG: pyridoxal phosphate-dependent aminotransferase [Anaerolineae bacterium]